MSAVKARSSGKMLSPSEVANFCAQISMIMKAGVSVQEGVSIMAEDNRGTHGEEILQSLSSHLETGVSFYEALRLTDVFPKYLLDMVEIGERSGRLDEVLESLCVYYERNEAIRKSIKNAITYPAVMIVMMLAVILVLIIKVLPIFSDVFRQLGSQLSPIAQGIMDFGMMLSQYSAVIVIVAVVIAVVIVLLRATSKGSQIGSWLYHNSFVTRKLVVKIAAGRFASAMATMLSSGLDIDQALEMSFSLVDDKLVQEKIRLCRTQIEQGNSFSDALAQSQIFSGVYTRMVTVGFKTGSIDGVMQKISERYEDEVDTHISSIISVLEPTLVAALSIIVGMILLSVMLPLMGVMSSIG